MTRKLSLADVATRCVSLLTMAALIAGAVQAQQSPDRPVWLVRTEIGVTWKEFLATTSFDSCEMRPRDSKHMRRTSQLPGYFNAVEKGVLRCYEVRVRNIMDRPIQCSAVVEQKAVPRGAGVRVEGDYVINPGFMDAIVIFLGPADPPPKKFRTKCFAIPAAPAPYVAPTAECRAELTMPPSQEFYPKILLGLGVHGDVQLEYGVQPGSDRPSDIRIVDSSGFPDLDSAALAMARDSRVRGGCAQTRFRTKVNFVAEPLPAEPEAPTAIMVVTAGQSHVNGDARWNSVVNSRASGVCGLTGADRNAELGDQASAQPRANADDCVATSARVHNTSAAPIYCSATFRLGQPDDSGRTEISAERLVLPGAMVIVATVYGEQAHAPSSAQTSCELRDVPLPPPPPCEYKLLKAPSPDDFYPEEAKQRQEQGDVILDFRVDPVARRVRDVRVSEGSGHRALDVAALAVGQLMTATTTCPDVRYRVKVKFRLP